MKKAKKEKAENPMEGYDPTNRNFQNTDQTEHGKEGEQNPKKSNGQDKKKTEGLP